MAFHFRLTGGGGERLECHTCCSLAASVNSCFLNGWFRTILQKGNYFLIVKINETLAASPGCSPVGGADQCQGPFVGKEGPERHQGQGVGNGGDATQWYLKGGPAGWSTQDPAPGKRNILAILCLPKRGF